MVRPSSLEPTHVRSLFENRIYLLLSDARYLNGATWRKQTLIFTSHVAMNLSNLIIYIVLANERTRLDAAMIPMILSSMAIFGCRIILHIRSVVVEDDGCNQSNFSRSAQLNFLDPDGSAPEIGHAGTELHN